MKTCRDCIGDDFCYLPWRRFEEEEIKEYTDGDIGDLCMNFKDKSKFIELPCSVGDYCIWHDDLWYVNNITYCCDGSFILWMSMADKSSYGAEAVASEVEFISKEEAEKKLEETK